MYILGQLCGLVGTAFTIARPQLRKKEQMLVCNILVNTMSALNYRLIGRSGPAVFLCSVAIVQSFVSIVHEKRKTSPAPWEAVLFLLLYMGFGFYGMLSSEGFASGEPLLRLLELLPVLGALMLMLSVFAKGEQRTRLFLVFNGAAWVIYGAAAQATSFFSSLASTISALIALLTHRREAAGR